MHQRSASRIPRQPAATGTNEPRLQVIPNRSSERDEFEQAIESANPSSGAAQKTARFFISSANDPAAVTGLSRSISRVPPGRHGNPIQSRPQHHEGRIRHRANLATTRARSNDCNPNFEIARIIALCRRSSRSHTTTTDSPVCVRNKFGCSNQPKLPTTLPVPIKG